MLFTPYNALGAPTTKNSLAPDVNRAEVEKSCFKV